MDTVSGPTLTQTSLNNTTTADIHDPQRMNPTDEGDHLTFPLAPPSDRTFLLGFMINASMPHNTVR